jgi:creatinine amidohydrolase
MLLSEMSWMDVEEYLRRDRRIVLVTGAVEQHGYLSLNTDTLIAYEIAKRAAEAEGVVVAPPLAYGISTVFADYPGTISLTAGTYLSVIEDIITSVHRSGFRKILILNGHGGNTPMRSVIYELADRLDGLTVKAIEWWTQGQVAELAQSLAPNPTHANWMENFPFCRTGDVPDVEKEMIEFPYAPSPAQTRELLGDGVFGGPYRASDEKMKMLLDKAVEVARKALADL